MSRLVKYRVGLFISMCLVVPLGYWIRFSGSGPDWLNDALGSVLFEVFWILLVLFLFHKLPPIRAAIAVLLATFGLEVMQLWQSPFWQTVRATLIGRLILGNTFTPQDFIAYALGCLVGWFWGRTIRSIV